MNFERSVAALSFCVSILVPCLTCQPTVQRLYSFTPTMTGKNCNSPASLKSTESRVTHEEFPDNVAYVQIGNLLMKSDDVRDASKVVLQFEVKSQKCRKIDRFYRVFDRKNGVSANSSVFGQNGFFAIYSNLEGVNRRLLDHGKIRSLKISAATMPDWNLDAGLILYRLENQVHSKLVCDGRASIFPALLNRGALRIKWIAELNTRSLSRSQAYWPLFFMEQPKSLVRSTVMKSTCEEVYPESVLLHSNCSSPAHGAECCQLMASATRFRYISVKEDWERTLLVNRTWISLDLSKKLPVCYYGDARLKLSSGCELEIELYDASGRLHDYSVHLESSKFSKVGHPSVASSGHHLQKFHFDLSEADYESFPLSAKLKIRSGDAELDILTRETRVRIDYGACGSL